MPIINFGDSLAAFIDWARGIVGAIENVATGSVTNTVQAILDIKELDCGGKWTVYVHTAIPAAGAAMWLLLTPSPQEIFESYLEPKKGRRGGRRGRRGERETRINQAGKRRIYFGGGIPDIDNQIADMLPGRGIFAGRVVGPGEWLFWTGVNVADRALWYWLLLEATETFATTWQSGLLESGQCIRSGPAYAKIQTPEKDFSNLDPLWNSTLDLPTNINHNTLTQVNGIVDLTIPNSNGIGYLVCDSTFKFINTAPTGTAIFQVGYVLSGHNADDGAFQIIEKGETVEVPPNSTITHNVATYQSFNKSDIWRGAYRLALLQGGGSITKSVTTNFEVMCEGVVGV